ncbi:Uncharacterised protein [Yersinia aleksiciae]|nr:Uncharacterised protein [Yersinia aleksiciae]
MLVVTQVNRPIGQGETGSTVTTDINEVQVSWRNATILELDAKSTRSIARDVQWRICLVVQRWGQIKVTVTCQ